MEAAKEATRRGLKDHENRSGTTVHGWPSVLIGMVAAAAGVPALLVALGYLAPDSASGTPGFILGVSGGIFALVGASFVTHGLAGARRKTRVRRGRERHPREPWRWDHPWDARGARDDSARRLALWAGRGIGFGLFSVPFNWLVLFSGELPWWGLAGFGLGTGLLDLLVLYAVYRFVRTLARLLRFGPGRLRYAPVPVLSRGDARRLIRADGADGGDGRA